LINQTNMEKRDMPKNENKIQRSNKTVNKAALVTSESSSIGAATALRLVAAGFTTYVAARRIEKMEGLKGRGVKVIGLDVTNEASINACIKKGGYHHER